VNNRHRTEESRLSVNHPTTKRKAKIGEKENQKEKKNSIINEYERDHWRIVSNG